MARTMVARGFCTLDKLEEMTLDDVDEHLVWQQAYDEAQERIRDRLSPRKE